jgi:hypothetical protein
MKARAFRISGWSSAIKTRGTDITDVKKTLFSREVQVDFPQSSSSSSSSSSFVLGRS